MMSYPRPGPSPPARAAAPAAAPQAFAGSRLQAPWPQPGPGPSRQQAARARADCWFALLGLAMWGGTGIKCRPAFTAAQTAQAALGWVAMLLISLVWPTAAVASYVRWRVPALAFLQLFLFVLPFNFDVSVVDAIAPQPGTGPMGPVINVFQLAMCIRVALLLFTSLGWRLPLRTHMVVQTLKVALLAACGTRPYCDSKLLSSHEMSSTFGAIHTILALLGTPLMPLAPASTVIPAGPYAQRVAILLLSWLLLGWLLPTLLLLPSADEAAAAAAPPPAPLRLEPAVSALEAGLRSLLPPPDRPPPAAAQLPFRWALVLRWWVVVQLSWGLCCAAAPLFAPHGAAAAATTRFVPPPLL